MKLSKIRNFCILSISLVFCVLSAVETDQEVVQVLQDVHRFYKNFTLGVNQSVVLVLGNKAAGKSVLTHLLTTDFDQISVKGSRLEFNGQRTIPETFIPTLFIDNKSNTSFYDCPVVNDASAEITSDVTAALSIQKLLAHAHEFKILFVITAESMSNVNDSSDFIKLAESAVELIKDTRKYSDGIALIVRTFESNGTAVQFDEQRDRELINKCIDFLKRTQLNLARPKSRLNAATVAAATAIDTDDDDDDEDEDSEERANREKISFISALFKNERIKILRLPMRVDALRREKDEILAMINSELRFVPKDDDDFLCKINENSKQQIPSLVAELKSQMEHEMPTSIAAVHQLYVNSEKRHQPTLDAMAEILLISERLEPNALKLPPHIERRQIISYDLKKKIEVFDFLQQFNANTEMHELNISVALRSQLRRKIDDTFCAEMIVILNAIKAIYLQNVKDFYLEIDKINAIAAEAHAKFTKINSGTREMFMVELLDVVAELEIDGLNGNMRRLTRNFEFIIVLQDFNQPIAERLATAFNRWKQYFVHLKIWYEFIRELRDQLAIYTVQQNKSVVNVPFMKVYIIGDDDDTVGPHIIELQTPLSYLANGSSVDRDAIENVRVSRYMLKALQTVWSSAMSEISIECPVTVDNRIRVKGDFISIRHVMERIAIDDCWIKARQIDILALNTVFIDADIDKRNDNVNFTIISPTWQIIPAEQPRQILLIGKNISEEWPVAQNGSVELERNGTNGKQGIRGGAGGNTLNIGHWFVNDEHLRIDVSGGKGGPGQIGGNGADGVLGDTPPVLTKAGNQALGFECNDRQTFSFHNGTLYTNYTCLGKSGIPPGNGGDGGCGGFGGDPGIFYIIPLTNSTTKINVVNRTGETGPDVGGGIGGKETAFGSDVYFQSHYTEGLFGTKLFEKWYRIMQGSDAGAKIDRGIDGTYPKNCSTIHPTLPVHFDIQPSVIAYKQFVWQNLAQSAWKTNLTNFIGDLQSNTAIQSSFDAIGYIDEFISLESDYFHLKNEINFYPMYEFIRHRFEQQQLQQTTKNQKHLLLIDTALTSKLLAIRNHTLIATDLDLLNDPNSMKKSIDALNADRIAYVKRMRDASRNSLVARIESAREFTESAMKAKSWSLHDENPCDECIEQLQAQMIHHQIVTSLRIVQSFLSLAVQDVRVLMDQAMVKNSQIESIWNAERKSTVALTTESTPYTTQMTQIAEHFHAKPHEFKELLVDFDGILKQDSNSKLNEIQQMIIDLTDRMNEILAHNGIPMENTTNALIFGQTNLTNAIEMVKSQFQAEKKKDKANERLNRMHDLLKCFALGIETYRNCRNNPKKLTALNMQIDRFQGNLRKWMEYEQTIHWIVLPRLKQMDKSIRNANVHNDTHFTIDVSDWNILPALMDIDQIFDRIRRRPLFDQNLEKSIDLMKQQVKMIFGLYNHIQVYADRVKLVTLLENIEKSSDAQAAEPRLDDKMAILSDSIYTSLMLELCRTTVQVQKIAVFPTDQQYLTLCEVTSPPTSFTNGSSQLIRKEFLHNIENLVEKSQFSDSVQPFYQWKYPDFKDEIQQLLNGKAVTFNADISTANALGDEPSLTDANAMKFQSIQLNFHLANETKQMALNEVLKNAQITMKMIGSSYYKCDRRIYSIPIDVDVVFKFKIENNRTISTESNGIDSKLMQMKPFLSPFTVWSIQLVSETNEYDQLKAFENDEIELQLSGDASSLNSADVDQHMCGDELNKNYQLDRIL